MGGISLGLYSSVSSPLLMFLTRTAPLLNPGTKSTEQLRSRKFAAPGNTALDSPVARFTRNGSNRFGAAHASDIEYSFNTLDSKKADWTPEDREAARAMAGYFANFVKTGNPNGPGLPPWPEFGKTREVMVLDAVSKAIPEPGRARYEFIDGFASK